VQHGPPAEQVQVEVGRRDALERLDGARRDDDLQGVVGERALGVPAQRGLEGDNQRQPVQHVCILRPVAQGPLHAWRGAEEGDEGTGPDNEQHGRTVLFTIIHHMTGKVKRSRSRNSKCSDFL
jgi:hypothetical protein